MSGISARTVLWTIALLGILSIIPFIYMSGDGGNDPIAPADYVIKDDSLNGGRAETADAESDGVPALDWEQLRTLNLETGQAPANLSQYDGKQVKIGGFMVPLEDEQYAVTEFLLVPYPQACIHVPAPPPNQIVHVTMAPGNKAEVAYYAPIWVYGRLKIETKQNIYTESSYTMSGLKTAPYTDAYTGF